MTMTFEQLEQAVIAWADEKGILAANDIDAQILKSVEELGEFSKAVQSGDAHQIKMELGDVFVTLILVGYMRGKETFTIHESALKPWLCVSPTRKLEGAKLFVTWVGEWYARESYNAARQVLNAAAYVAGHFDFTVTEALQAAYDKISKRKGSIVNGAFVKEGE